MINSKNGFTLHYPLNCWDMNYHLIDDNAGNDYLIDICDISDEDDDNYYSWEKLKALEDIDEIKELAWKII